MPSGPSSYVPLELGRGVAGARLTSGLHTCSLCARGVRAAVDLAYADGKGFSDPSNTGLGLVLVSAADLSSLF